LDLLNPRSTIFKIAGSSKGYSPSILTRNKFSRALKGVYTGENSPLFGTSPSEETRELMSQTKMDSKNPMFGKTHSESTKE
jgi:group I intron endonuclease